MKRIILAAMAVMTLAGSANAASDWDIFWGTTVSQALDPKLNGWDDFWGQCQNPEKTAADCVGVVATGTVLAVAIPFVAASVAITGAAMIPTAGTAVSMIYYGPLVPVGMGNGLT